MKRDNSRFFDKSRMTYQHLFVAYSITTCVYRLTGHRVYLHSWRLLRLNNTNFERWNPRTWKTSWVSPACRGLHMNTCTDRHPHRLRDWSLIVERTGIPLADQWQQYGSVAGWHWIPGPIQWSHSLLSWTGTTSGVLTETRRTRWSSMLGPRLSSHRRDIGFVDQSPQQRHSVCWCRELPLQVHDLL